MSIRQIGWTSQRFGIIWSKNPGYYKRFSVVERTEGYTVTDHQTGDTARVTTRAAAFAWAGIRIGERCIRHH